MKKRWEAVGYWWELGGTSPEESEERRRVCVCMI
jgi:hypothetical protein